VELLAAAACLLVFLGLYAFLQRRSSQPVQWGWLAAIVGCAAVALIIGALAH
jgi:hypothetical protein